MCESEGGEKGTWRLRRRRGRGQEPREGAVPPCRPAAVCATRYHWPVMCASLSRSHWYRSECLVTALSAVTVNRLVCA